MPRTKPEPKAQQLAPANGPTGDVLTLSEAAGYLRLPEAEVLRLVREQGLPARHVGHEWRFLLGAIRDWLGGTPAKPSKEAWMELAGVWKDDPSFDQLLREIGKGRG
jgi:excisionase family DNA binding protein